MDASVKQTLMMSLVFDTPFSFLFMSEIAASRSFVAAVVVPSFVFKVDISVFNVFTLDSYCFFSCLYLSTLFSCSSCSFDFSTSSCITFKRYAFRLVNRSCSASRSSTFLCLSLFCSYKKPI